MQAILRGLPSTDPLLKVPDFNRSDLYQYSAPLIGRNKFINPAFDIFQYGTSAVNTGALGKPDRADRYVVFNNTDATVTHQKANPSLLTYDVAKVRVDAASQLTVSVADGTLTGDQRCLMYQVIEGYNARNLPYTGFTYSFWLYGPGGYYSAFAGDNTNYCVVPFSLPHNKWTKVVVRFPRMPMSFAGSTTNGVGLSVGICLAMSSSSTYATANTGSWQASVKIGLTSQSNGVSSNTNAFYTSLWQVEEGEVATPFEYRPMPAEMLHAQRYYEKSYSIGTAPGAAAEVQSSAIILTGTATSNTIYMRVFFKVPKRTYLHTMRAWDQNATPNLAKCTVYNTAVAVVANNVALADFQGYDHGFYIAANYASISGFSVNWDCSAEF